MDARRDERPRGTEQPSVQQPGIDPRHLECGEVHVWIAGLDRSAEQIARMSLSLDREEIARAARFRTDEHRNRFIVSRAAQREILSGYGGVDPASITYEYSAHGKPSLRASGTGLDSIRFNVTNSVNRALVAVAWEREVGVDVEAQRTIRDAGALARRFFSPSEYAALQTMHDEAVERAFLSCWTRKEAYVKAIGLGISMQLAGFDVNVEPDEPATLLATRHDAAAAARWTMHSLDAGAGYFATLVVEGEPAAVRTFEWRPED
jgi:4'-phosphopantetheinyl transferase